MSGRLKRRLRTYRDQKGSDAGFAEHLLECIATIERDFEGEQRERLMSLADETFQRHLQIRRITTRARSALAQLRADQERLLELLGLVAAPPGRTVH